MDLAVPTDHRVKIKESEKRDKSQGNKKVIEHEGNGETSYNWLTWNGSQRLGKAAVRVGNQENQRTNRDYLDYSNVKID